MGRKVYISFKTEDAAYKEAIQALPNLDYVDKSLNEAIDSTNDDYIMQKIRSDYLYDSTVTIFLIGQYSHENLGSWEQRYIKKELQASLYTTGAHSKNGILGIVLPHMHQSIYGGTYHCFHCNGSHNSVKVNDATTVKEFSHNYYIPHDKCAHTEDERYCVLVGWDDFVADPNAHIEAAFEKRSHPIANKTKVRP